ncbi:MAG: hypothetical protein QW454_04255, partial [Candidatus Bathyarchaeia archaeon]
LRSKSNMLCITLFGVLSYLLLSLFLENTPIIMALTLVLGIAYGLTTPTYLSFSAIYSEIERRGRLSGFLLFFTQFCMIAYCTLLRFNASLMLLAIAGLKMINIVNLLLYKPLLNQSINMTDRYKDATRNRSFVLYFVPWFMFCLVNYIEEPILRNAFGEETSQLYMISAASAGISAFLGGYFCDLKGRKVVSILGFILLGVSYGVLSFLNNFGMVKIFFMSINGIAWGMLYVIFVFVIWGDISEGRVREPYYFLGNLPFLLSNIIYFTSEKSKVFNFISLSTSFSIASFFIFLAVVPLLYAPETLPERVIREKELRSYVEKAKRLVEKYS